MLAFSVAFERWMKANDGEPFPPFADAALTDLQARAAQLVLPSFRPAFQPDVNSEDAA
jgi:hypothetical protein